MASQQDQEIQLIRDQQGIEDSIDPNFLADRLQGISDATIVNIESVSQQYMFDSDTSATPPANGFIKADNADPTLITALLASDMLMNLPDYSEIFSDMTTGDFIILTEVEGSASWIGRVAADSIDNTGYHTIPVTYVSSAGTIPDNALLSINYFGTSPRIGNVIIQRLLDGVSTAANQQPTGLGEANSAQIEFGPAQLTPSDPIQLLADGTLIVNKTGLYRLKVSVVYGRFGIAGESNLRFRALANGVQSGISLGAEIDNARVQIPYENDAWLFLPAGIQFTWEIMRDSSGTDSGGIFQPVVTAATAPSWNPCSCATIRVERLANI